MHLITCFVLKNSPPRLELATSEGPRDSDHGDFEAVRAPSLDEVEVILQEGNKTVADIPDDQYLVFKTQRARLPATKNVMGHLSAYLGIRMIDGTGQMIKTKILDRCGHPVGEYVAERIGELDLKEHVERDFLYLASEHSRGKGGKTVHVLEVEQKDGIWYRVDAADIDAEAWSEAVVGEELVILG